MQKLTEKCFKAQMAILCELYGDISEIRENITRRVLHENRVTDEQFEKGIMKLCSNRKYDTHKFPQPSEMIEFIFGDKKELTDNKAEYAKSLVCEAIRKAGAYKSVAFDDPVIHAIIKGRLGGWITLCNMDQEEFKNFMKFGFSKAYNGYTQQGIGLIDKVLLGRSDRANEGKFEPQDVKLFGNVERVLAWQARLEKIEKTGVRELAENKGVKNVEQ